MQIDTTIPEFEIILSDTDLDNKVDVNEPVVNNDADDSDFDSDNDVIVETPAVEKTYAEAADPAAIAVYEQLVEKGYVDNDEDFDGTWDQLDSNLENLPQRVLNSLVANTSDVSKDIVRFVFSSDNITAEEILEFVKTNYEESNIQSVEIETMDDARSFLERTYKERGMKPRAAEAAIAALEEDDLLLEEAKEEYQKVAANAKPKTEALIAAKENETAAAIESKNKFTADIITELNNTGWKPNKIEEVKNRIAKNEVNQLLTDIFKSPKAFVKMVDFIGYFKDGDINYDNFINTVETPKGKDMKSKFESAINSPTLSTKSNFKNLKTSSDGLRPVFD